LIEGFTDSILTEAGVAVATSVAVSEITAVETSINSSSALTVSKINPLIGVKDGGDRQSSIVNSRDE
jgi:hypothetical protein